MSGTQGSTTASVENRNADVIQGLREVADFLEAHPEVGGRVHTHVGVYTDPKQERATLTALAVALGERAEEKYENGRVKIAASFPGSVRLEGSCNAEHLGAHIPTLTPEYEPIIARTDGES